MLSAIIGIKKNKHEKHLCFAEAGTHGTHICVSHVGRQLQAQFCSREIGSNIHPIWSRGRNFNLTVGKDFLLLTFDQVLWQTMT